MEKSLCAEQRAGDAADARGLESASARSLDIQKFDRMGSSEITVIVKEVRLGGAASFLAILIQA